MMKDNTGGWCGEECYMHEYRHFSSAGAENVKAHCTYEAIQPIYSSNPHALKGAFSSPLKLICHT